MVRIGGEQVANLVVPQVVYRRGGGNPAQDVGKARERGDREEAQRHFDEVDRLFNQLETYLAYVGSAR